VGVGVALEVGMGPARPKPCSAAGMCHSHRSIASCGSARQLALFLPSYLHKWHCSMNGGSLVIVAAHHLAILALDGSSAAVAVRASIDVQAGEPEECGCNAGHRLWTA
jgi:hypothetical protein